MKKIIFAIMMLSICASPVSAGTLAETFDGIIIMGPAPDPLLTTLIEDNFSHTISLLDARSKKYTWYGLTYNGTGTCIIRPMNTDAKASYVAHKVSAGTIFNRVVNKNALFLNYSGCRGTTYTSNGTSNSTIELN